MDYEKECKNFGGDLDDALTVTSDFLVWFIEYLEREEPYATNSISVLQHALTDLPGSMKED